MPANTPTVKRFHAVLRDGASAYAIPAAQWVDNFVLAGGVAEPYTPPTDADGRDATLFRIVANADLWIDPNGGTAAVPAADLITGGGRILVPASVPYFFSQPVAGQPISLICAGAALVSIEAWT